DRRHPRELRDRSHRRLHDPAGAGGLLGALVRSLQGDRAAAGEAGDRVRGPLQAGEDRFRPGTATRGRVRHPQHPHLRPADERAAGRRFHGRGSGGQAARVPRQARAARGAGSGRRSARPPGGADGRAGTAREAAACAGHQPIRRRHAVRVRQGAAPGRPAGGRQGRLCASRSQGGRAPAARLGATGHRCDGIRRHARRRSQGGGRLRYPGRGEPARLRGPLRQGPPADGPAALDRRDGRVARDPDARQGLERGCGAQDLHRDPRHHRTAQAEGGRGADPPGRPDRRDVPAPTLQRGIEL
ncbi:MAG: FIG000875: Thioredoxin domain-containing protein EC-YbbN, partial [uncultured Ramlibacter sp.]